MATHSSILAWRILWTEEPGGLLSMRSPRVRHKLSDLACMNALEKEMVTAPVILPGESQRQRSLVGCRLWGCTESDTTEGTQQQQQQPPLVFPSFYSSLHFVVHYWHSFVYISILLPLECLLGRASTIGQHNSLPTAFVQCFCVASMVPGKKKKERKSCCLNLFYL